MNSSYAMENLPTTPTGENDVKQLTEEVKQVPDDSKNAINDVTDEFSILNIDKTIQQLNCVNVGNNKQKTENKTSNNKVTSKDVFFYNSNGEQLVDLDKLVTRPFKTMTDDEKDWSRLKIYDKFSHYCQIVIQNALTKNEISLATRKQFVGTNLTKYCVMVGLDPHDIFEAELKLNTNPACYRGHYELFETIRRLLGLCHHLISTKQWYREKLLKAGFVDGF